MHSGKIKAPTIWEIANAQGARVGVYNLPLTYPPRAWTAGWCRGCSRPVTAKNSMDSLHGAGPAAGMRSRSKILEWAPGYVLDLHANYETDWRDEGLRCDADRIRRATRTGPAGPAGNRSGGRRVQRARSSPTGCSTSITATWIPTDPLHASPQAQRIRPLVDECFVAMDRIVGLLADYAGDDGGIFVCSDHGFTAWEVSVHTNALLERWGYLKLKSSARAMQSAPGSGPGAGGETNTAAQGSAGGEGTHVRGDRLGRDSGICFSDPPAGHLRESGGSRTPRHRAFNGAGVPQGRDRQRFRTLTDPDGAPVTDHVWLSEEVFKGEALEGAPDVLPVLRDHRFELDDEIFHRDPFTDVIDLPRGVHHPDGIGIVAGAGARVGRALTRLGDRRAPTLLYQAGLEVPEGLDGRS